MRILVIEGPGDRPASYPRVLKSAFHHLGHRVIHHGLRDLSGAWVGRREVVRVAETLFRRAGPDVVHVLSSEPWVAEAFVGFGVPVVHTTEEKPSRTDWTVVPSRLGMDRVAGKGEGLDYRVGVLPYAVESPDPVPTYGPFALLRMDPDDREASRWVEEAAWRAPFVPLRDRGDIRAARFVVCVSSRKSAWPFGVAEAMAAGRPVIATWGGAAPEFVREGVTGFLSAPGDAASLSEHMVWLWDRPEKALEMGRTAREHAEHSLDPERHARTLIRWYMRAGASRMAI